MARPQDEGIALRYVEDENAASGVGGRRDAAAAVGTVH
jgi:hypothetical protein